MKRGARRRRGGDALRSKRGVENAPCRVRRRARSRFMSLRTVRTSRAEPDIGGAFSPVGTTPLAKLSRARCCCATKSMKTLVASAKTGVRVESIARASARGESRAILRRVWVWEAGHLLLLYHLICEAVSWQVGEGEIVVVVSVPRRRVIVWRGGTLVLRRPNRDTSDNNAVRDGSALAFGLLVLRLWHFLRLVVLLGRWGEVKMDVAYRAILPRRSPEYPP